jgi:hypothetical protein
MPSEIISNPWALSSEAFVETAIVGDGLMLDKDLASNDIKYFICLKFDKAIDFFLKKYSY